MIPSDISRMAFHWLVGGGKTFSDTTPGFGLGVFCYSAMRVVIQAAPCLVCVGMGVRVPHHLCCGVPL